MALSILFYITQLIYIGFQSNCFNSVELNANLERWKRSQIFFLTFASFHLCTKKSIISGIIKVFIHIRRKKYCTEYYFVLMLLIFINSRELHFLLRIRISMRKLADTIFFLFCNVSNNGVSKLI